MRLISFERNRKPSFGIVVGEQIVDAGSKLAGRFRNLREVLIAGEMQRLRDMQELDPDCALTDVTHLPVIADPAAKILCVGVNYLPHIKEMGRERPPFPVLFVRFADSIVGHEQPLVRPSASVQFDYEGELAVVIGKTARHVTRARAYEHVAGY